jgi:hypothetical protein
MHSTSIFVLVPDIWHMVASGFDRRTLIQLCLTSSQFLEISRPMLYRNFILSIDSRKYRHVDLTLKLLCSHDTLAQYVTSLTIFARLERNRSRSRPTRRCKVIRALFPGVQERLIKAIAKMSSLESIQMHNTVFASIFEERAFVARLRECNIPVRNFALIADCRLGRAKLSKNGLSLSHLTTLTWNLKWTERYQSK